MLVDIQTCSLQQLNAALHILSMHSAYVFWIRNDLMTRQIYLSPSYELIWGRKMDILFDVPLIWFDFLNPDDKVNAMRQLDARHSLHYLDQEKNSIQYQVNNDKGEIVYIKDQSFRMQDHLGRFYVVGLSRSVASQIWYPDNASENKNNAEDSNVYEHFFSLLKDSFGLISVAQHNKTLVDESDILKVKLPATDFSKRELECLLFLCRGQTYKEIARAMAISPRTVETHVERMRIKSECGSKLHLISRFGRYFDPN